MPERPTSGEAFAAYEDSYAEAFRRTADEHAERIAPAWTTVFERAVELGKQREQNPDLYRSRRFPVIHDPRRRNRGRTPYSVLDTDTARDVGGAETKATALELRAAFVASDTCPETRGYRHPLYAHTWRGRLVGALLRWVDRVADAVGMTRLDGTTPEDT
jgi:hypothetical protein